MNSTSLTVVVAAVVVVVAFYLSYVSAAKREKDLREQLSSAATRERELRDKVPLLAAEHLERWKQAEVQAIRDQEAERAISNATTALREWRTMNEASIRQDAINRSVAVRAGQVAEQLLPVLPIFPYNPKDVKFVGSPIDLIVFDGLEEGEVRRVIFLEVKVGASRLNARQRQIRDVIERGDVVFQVMNPTTMGEPLQMPLLTSGREL
ncbi:MAG: hypothetical protein JWM27_2662 [Gemmatimonadetes bacterium]|nr:hypothetical protein [Gemmatimonadota bacterium]